jgi:hypothetical protein
LCAKIVDLATKAKKTFLKKGQGPKSQPGAGGSDAMFGAKKKGNHPNFNSEGFIYDFIYLTKILSYKDVNFNYQECIHSLCAFISSVAASNSP